jgi:hypothetical protein
MGGKEGMGEGLGKQSLVLHLSNGDRKHFITKRNPKEELMREGARFFVCLFCFVLTHWI